MRLTERKIAKLKNAGRYRDGHGLILQVADSGAKSWIFRFERDGRERWMGLGPIHTISLAQARLAAQRARRLLLEGVDPIEQRHAERDAQRADARAQMSFKEAVERYLKVNEPTWKNAKHIQQWRMRLKKYVSELLPRPVAAVDEATINEALAGIWTTMPETARRIRRRVRAICQWVKDGQPLPTRDVALKARKMPALPYRDVPQFMVELRAKEGISPRALEFLILCASRTGEVLGATWPEINLEEKLWTIPAERMKAGREHRVPLSDRAIEILKSLPTEKDNPHIFIGARKGKPLSSMALLMLMRDLREGFVPHGFRSSFKDWCADCTNFPNIVSEQALAHTVQGVEAHYRRGDLLDKRRKLMSAWSGYCSTQPANEFGNVVAMTKAKAA